MRRAVLVPFILAAVVSVARAEEVTSEGWGGFFAWREWTEWGMDGGVEEQPAYIYPAEYLDYGTKLLECTNIHLSTQAEASIRISLLKLDWGGQRVPRWPDGPPAMIPVHLHTHLEISADGAWNWQDADEQVDATFDFDDGQFAYYSVNVNRDEDLGAGWRDVVSEAIFGRVISPGEWGPQVIVHQWIAPEYLMEFPEPDWRMDTWGDFTARVTISVEPNEPPVAVATADPVEVEPGVPVTFSGAQSTDPNDDPLTYTWEFSDGAYAQGVEVQHPFDEPGQHGATLMVEDGRFAYDIAFVEVLVKSANEPPVAALSVEPELTLVGLEVTFHTTGTSDPDGDDLSYVLDFGDGEPAAAGTLVPPYADLALTHTYTATGTYTATFTVHDDESEEDDATVQVRVVEIDALVIDPKGTKKEPIQAYVDVPYPFSAVGTWYGDDGIPGTADDMIWDVTGLSTWQAEPVELGTIANGILMPAEPLGDDRKTVGSVTVSYARKYDVLEDSSVVMVFDPHLTGANWTNPLKGSRLEKILRIGEKTTFAAQAIGKGAGGKPAEWDFDEWGELRYMWTVRRKGEVDPFDSIPWTPTGKHPAFDYAFMEPGEYRVAIELQFYPTGEEAKPSPAEVPVTVEGDLPAVNLIIHDGQTGMAVSENQEDKTGAFTVPNLNDTDRDGKVDTEDAKVVKVATTLHAAAKAKDPDITVEEAEKFEAGDKIVVSKIVTERIGGREEKLEVWEYQYVKTVVGNKISLQSPDGLSYDYDKGAKVGHEGEGEVDLAKLIIEKTADGVEGNVELKITGPVAAWKSSDKSEGLEKRTTFAVADLPVTLWLEGLRVSSGLMDVKIDVSQGGEVLDKACLTLLACNLTAYHAPTWYPTWDRVKHKVPEDLEESQGVFAVANKNDTNSRRGVDLTEKTYMKQEVDLIQLHIAQPEPKKLQGEIRLRFLDLDNKNIDGTRTRVWKESAKLGGEETRRIFTTPQDWRQYGGVSMWLEGLEPSSRVRDIEIQTTYKGIVLDRVRATFVWVNFVGALHDNSDDVLATWPKIAGTPTETVLKKFDVDQPDPNKKVPKVGLTKHSPRGLKNVIAFKYRALPTGVGRKETKTAFVKFDSTRQLEAKAWVVRRPRPHVLPPKAFPKQDDDANDDDFENYGETNDPSPEGYLFAHDEPGPRLVLVNRGDIRQLWRLNAREFYRVKFDDHRPGERGRSVSGSRCSEKYEWRGAHTLVPRPFGGYMRWTRSTGDNREARGTNDIGPGRIDLPAKP